jgi:hypothetical protein
MISKLLSKCENLLTKKLLAKKECKICKHFWKYLFLGALFPIFHGFEDSVRFCVFLILT